MAWAIPAISSLQVSRGPQAPIVAITWQSRLQLERWFSSQDSAAASRCMSHIDSRFRYIIDPWLSVRSLPYIRAEAARSVSYDTQALRPISIALVLHSRANAKSVEGGMKNLAAVALLLSAAGLCGCVPQQEDSICTPRESLESEAARWYHGTRVVQEHSL